MPINNHVTGLQHLGVPVRDLDLSVEFYRSLGFEQAFATRNQGARVVFLRQKGLVLELYESADATGVPGAIDHLALDVTDIAATFSAAKALGCHLLDREVQFLPFWENGVRFFTILGPNGEKVEFSQML